VGAEVFKMKFHLVFISLVVMVYGIDIRNPKFPNDELYSSSIPLKVEILSLDPYVIIFHDVIYDREIQELKSIELSTLRHDRSEYPKNSMKYVTLEKEGNDVLNNRIKDMTGMKIGKDKDFWLMNYGLAGHIKLHLDEQPVSYQIKLKIK